MTEKANLKFDNQQSYSHRNEIHEFVDLKAHVTLKYDRRPRKATENLCHVPYSYVCHLVAIHGFKLELQSGINFGLNRRPPPPPPPPRDIEIWRMTSKNASLAY